MGIYQTYAIVVLGGGLLALARWYRRAAREQQEHDRADLVPRWGQFISGAPATGEPAIPAARVPAVRPLHAVTDKARVVPFVRRSGTR